MLAGLRIFAGLFLVGGVVWAGWAAAPLVSILALAVIFAICFGLGRWRAWVMAAQTGTLGRAVALQAGTLAVQAVMVSLFYLIGRGLSAVFGPMPLPVEGWLALGLFAAFGIGLGAAVAYLEAQGKGGSLPFADPTLPPEHDARADQPSIPVTDETFFQGHHSSHTPYVWNAETQTGEFGPLDEGAIHLTDAQIEAEEQRMAIRLPERLYRLYQRQNGGSCMSWAAPDRVGLRNAENGWINVFSGYDDCVPLTLMRSLASSIEDYASHAEQPEMFPEGAERMFILAQWYRETLFLDYRAGDEPRVGFTDFDDFEDLRDPAWEERTQWWPHFDAFLADLRRRPSDVRDRDEDD